MKTIEIEGKKHFIDSSKTCFQVIDTHVSDICHGDIILVDGGLCSVSRKDIKHDSFFGTSIKGYSYKGGRLPVKKALIYKAMPTLSD